MTKNFEYVETKNNKGSSKGVKTKSQSLPNDCYFSQMQLIRSSTLNWNTTSQTKKTFPIFNNNIQHNGRVKKNKE